MEQLKKEYIRGFVTVFSQSLVFNYLLSNIKYIQFCLTSNKKCNAFLTSLRLILLKNKRKYNKTSNSPLVSINLPISRKLAAQLLD